MAASSKSPGESLFNNPAFSNVKIKLHYNGSVHEYHAHTMILASGSRFFLNAFTGQFKEASENVIELHDDVPEHFEIVLKFLYTHRYDKDAIVKLADNNQDKRVLTPIGVHVIADKYDIELLSECMADDVGAILPTYTQWSTYKAVIQGFYGGCSRARSPVGTIIARTLIEHSTNFVGVAECKDLMQQFPCFGADIALEMHGRSKYFSICGTSHKLLG
ncbi:hypothetical protein P171DRAFT_16702 [Karstenula rhodostoma CBS 690.94]|uniref:BTB domain-containing protein n=1 Tax=Karstenula rhodostoma CBS 690.94 TaxID=1392251 RepID=A0A9P4PXF4_9PLEO|nr:hypothetical protein P171DRAFT_16702 [Karstenula rhodostoma CBS 690.94]